MSDVLPVDLTITIRAETSFADPDACKFTVSRTVHPGGPFFFDNVERAGGSPLPERLFALDGVAHVLVADNVVTVNKEPSVSWSELKPAIGAALRTHLLTGIPAILEAPAPRARGGGPTPRSVQSSRSSWTGRSTDPSRTTAGRSRSSTSTTESSPSR
jgi:hypothetical protein